MYEMVIGLEIHVKLSSPNKLFCRCKNVQDEQIPNLHICPVCTGQPGALPVLNKEPLEKAVLLGLALNCKINNISYFDRKSYFYPDLPMGYQITQYTTAIAEEGYLEFYVFDEIKKVRIQRAHLENDAGKTIHEGKAYLDYNRAGTPLVEIVTYPDFRSSDEVVEFLKELQRIIRQNNIGYADMEKGQLRCDVNISVRKKGEDKFGTKVELKNMNSFAAIKRAIEYEFERQVKLISSGGKVEQETRGWDDLKRENFIMRSKEDAMDYRYFPEPDLPPLYISTDFINSLKEKLLPSFTEKIKKYKEWNFSKEYINGLLNYKINLIFEKLVEDGVDKNLAAKWVNNYLLRFLDDLNIKNIAQITYSNKLGKDYVEDIINEVFQNLGYTYATFYKFLKYIQEGKINENIAKNIIKELSDNIDDLINKYKIDFNIDEILEKVINENQKAVEDIKSGNEKAMSFLIGQIMKYTRGSIDPKTLPDLIKAKIFENK